MRRRLLLAALGVVTAGAAALWVSLDDDLVLRTAGLRTVPTSEQDGGAHERTVWLRSGGRSFGHHVQSAGAPTWQRHRASARLTLPVEQPRPG